MTKRHLTLILTLTAVLGVNLYFRAFPIYFPQLKQRSKKILEQSIRQGIASDVYRKFPQFDPLANERVIKSRIAEYSQTAKKAMNGQIKEGYRSLKEKFQDERGQTYLMELDCWHWARYVENVVNTGHPGDQTVGNKQLDLFMLAPQGSYMHWDQFLFYLSAFLYKGFSLFKKVALFDFLFYLPLFFIAVFIAVLYMFSYRLGRHIAAVVACLFVGLSPIFLPRSCAGWFDKDILSLLFPLLVVWTYTQAHCAYTLKRRMLWVVFSAFWVGIFCFTWTHWWFIFLIIIGYEAYSLVNIFFAYLSYKEKSTDSLRRHLFSLAVFLSSGLLWILILAGPTPLIELYKQIKLALILNNPLLSSIWPNVYSTVQELKKPDSLLLMHYVGSRFLYLSGLLSMLVIFLTTTSRRRQRDFKQQAVVVMIFWFMGMFFAASKGIRFVVFLLPPLGISLGCALNDAHDYARRNRKKWLALGVLVITAVFIVNLVNNGRLAARGIYPMMNDTFYDTLAKIRGNTPPSAIINSWWDLGDWFKVAARRRVIFDGQSQDTPQAYWMANVLLTDNEEEAVRILRMLNNGGNRAFEIIDKQLKDPFKSVLLLKKALLLPSQEARAVLSRVLPAAVSGEVTGLLFDRPDSAYFVVEHTMAGKIRPISFLGYWDFAKVYIAQNIGKKSMQDIGSYLSQLGVDSLQAEGLFQEAVLIDKDKLDLWISGRPQYFIDDVRGRERNGSVLFDNGSVYIPKEQAMYVYSVKERKYRIPHSMFFLDGDTLKEVTYPDSNVAFSVLMIKTPDDYRAVLLESKLARSMFTRLFFLGGMGLKHFKPFIEETDDRGGPIRVFEIVWD